VKWSKGSKTNFKNPQHNYTKALIASRPSVFSIEKIAYDSGLLRG
jgi:ABC-type dipeptide/oligopeptide/nickel transport system ATPase component